MKAYLSLLAVLAWGIPQTATVSGKILDREGQPMAGVQVTYTHVGEYTNTSSIPNVTNSGTGKVYKTKTNKKGEFIMTGLAFGVYQVEVMDQAGARVYSGKKAVGDNGDTTMSNVLNVDLSTVAPPGTASGSDDNMHSAKSKDQLALIRQENSNTAKMNRLILEARTALAGQDWTHAADLLHQLIALDPNRWEFYQNLATIQANQGQYQEAVQSYRKGVELLERTLASASDPAKTRTEISNMMISEADALHHLDKLDDATELYNRAAALAPQPAMAYFHACNAQANRGTSAAAIDFCSKAIAADPSQWDFYQVLAGAQNASGKSQDAIATYARGVQAAREELAAKPDSSRAKNGLGQMLNAEGNLYAQQSKYDEAITAFAEAAKVSAYAALPYFNLCATYYNLNHLPETVTACDQAIASDPTMSEAYYLKASALFGTGKLEQGRYAPPAETRAALNKYLELAPFGPHAQLVREMLDKLDAAIDTSYKPGKPDKR
jgi:tetratricopeptide (TPR) repeat protein